MKPESPEMKTSLGRILHGGKVVFLLLPPLEPWSRPLRGDISDIPHIRCLRFDS